jgi:Arf-GAP/coiled-coil/ANK repeat/PH domain-containing protein
LFILLCLNLPQVCSGIHRSLGVHVSKVRSIVLDDLDTELLDMMVGLGNARTNALWEGSLPPEFVRPVPGSLREQKEEFIHSKYVKRSWLAPAVFEPPPTLDEKYANMFKACETDDLEALVVHMLQGCDVDWRNVHDHGKTALHHAASYDSILACEYLIQNGANQALEDTEHKTPLDYAKEADSKRVIVRLQGAASKNKH